MRYEKTIAGAGENLCTGKDAHANPDNARYCESCGNRTVNFQKGLLKPYDVVLHEHENVQEGMTVAEFETLLRK